MSGTKYSLYELFIDKTILLIIDSLGQFPLRRELLIIDDLERAVRGNNFI